MKDSSNKENIMNQLQKIVVVISPHTRTMLESLKTAAKMQGRRETLGGIVDRLVEYEYKRNEKEA